MRYHNITKDDMKNGPGLRTVLWVAGCDHHCKGCQNPETWDPEGGLAFDLEAEDELFGYLNADYCSGLTLSGGDPLYFGNRVGIRRICYIFRCTYGYDKDIWLYTGYTMARLEKLRTADKVLDDILRMVDVVVDGPYIEEQRNTSRFWVGSDNQELWKQDFKTGLFHKMPKEYLKSLSEEQHESEKGCCDG